jgi:hypothetical protein
LRKWSGDAAGRPAVGPRETEGDIGPVKDSLTGADRAIGTARVAALRALDRIRARPVDHQLEETSSGRFSTHESLRLSRVLRTLAHHP